MDSGVSSNPIQLFSEIKTDYNDDKIEVVAEYEITEIRDEILIIVVNVFLTPVKTGWDEMYGFGIRVKVEDKNEMHEMLTEHARKFANSLLYTRLDSWSDGDRDEEETLE